MYHDTFSLYMSPENNQNLSITALQAQCKRPHDPEEAHEFRRPFNQIKFTTNAPAQQTISRLLLLTNKPMVNFEVFKNQIKDLHKETGAKLPVRIAQDKPSIKTSPVMGKKGKHHLKKPKKLNEAKKKAIRERFWHKEKMDALEMERKKVDELQQNVARLRKELRAKRHKKKNHKRTQNNGEILPVMRSHQGNGAETPGSPAAPAKKNLKKSRFNVETKAEKILSMGAVSSSSPMVKRSSDSSGDSDGDPVMRGADIDPDDDEELNFDVEGEFLSQLV